MKLHEKKKPKLRLLVQLLFFVLILFIVLSHTLAESGIVIPFLSGASVHAVCPFGGVVSIYQLITQSTLVKKIHESSMVLMVIVFGLGITLGPVFCGWVCPFGTIQELIGKVGKRIFGERYNAIIPIKIDKVLRYLRYVVLGWVLYMTAISGVLIFADYDPYYVLFNFWTGEVAISGFIVLGIVLVASLFVERPFCKYACPYGAVLGLFNFIKFFPVRRNKLTCVSCNKCNKKCPMNIEVAKVSTIRNHQCISCNECSSENTCPIEGTVEMKFKRWEGKE